jgi:hypothetical protein
MNEGQSLSGASEEQKGVVSVMKRGPERGECLAWEARGGNIFMND